MTRRHLPRIECQPQYELKLAAEAGREPEDEQIATILDLYMIELEEGREAYPEELYQRHPELAEKLRSYLSGINIVQCLSEAAHQSPKATEPSNLRLSRDAFLFDDITDETAAPAGSTLSHGVDSDTTCRSSVQSESDTHALGELSIVNKGNRLGDYLLGPIIGQGAMGVVYKAHDMRRGESVAIKVLTDHGNLDPSRIDRFRREAKTAASLDHPNLVPVYSVGCSQGTHYYAMQLIEGESLDRRITATRLLGEPGAAIRRSNRHSLVRMAAPLVGTDRYCRIAQMGASAAAALHAAHVAGVIHRDIKPSNLVLGHDGQLWLTDFGLARVLSEAGLTRTGELVGTIRYMSPEQANGQGDLIDARTDVYALGVTLYELATLTQAFEGDDPMQVLRSIRSTEPIPPRALDSNLPYDLEVIILRAMRPRSADRYPTAAAMADDLQRFVAGKPILAHSVTWTERGISWVRKHRQLAAGLLAVFSLLSLMSFVVTYLIIQEQAETLLALRTKNHHFEQARQAVDTLGTGVARQLVNIPEAAAIRLDILASTTRYYKQFIKDSANDPRLRLDVAHSKLEIARLTTQSDSLAAADLAYRDAAQAFLDPMNDPKPPQRGTSRFEYVRLLNEWALISDSLGDQSAAQSKLENALSELDQCLVPEDKRRVTLLRALTYNNLGVVAIRANDVSGGKAALKNSIGLLQTLTREQSTNAELESELADALSNLSILLGSGGQFAESVAAAEQSLRIRLHSIAPENAEQECRVAITCNNLASIYWNAGKSELAVNSYQRAITLLEHAVEIAPTQIRPRNRLAVTLNNLGMALVSLGDYGDAEHAFRRAESLAHPAFDAAPSDEEAAQRLATIQNNLGLLLQNLGRGDEAERIFRKANRTWRSKTPLPCQTEMPPPALQQIPNELEQSSYGITESES